MFKVKNIPNKNGGGRNKKYKTIKSTTKKQVKSLYKKWNTKNNTKKRNRFMNKKGGTNINKSILNINKFFVPANMRFDHFVIAGKPLEDIARNGCLFNPTIYEHDTHTLIGLARFCYTDIIDDGDDIKINEHFTTTTNRYPYSTGSPWRTGWSGALTDQCIFFIIQDNPFKINFYKINSNTEIKFGLRIEDPRITKLGNIYVLYGHCSHLKPGNVGEIGQNRNQALELKPKDIKTNITLPVISYLEVSYIDTILSTPSNSPIYNSDWKLVCKNWLPYDVEKNFAMISREQLSKLDLIYSLGGHTESMVVISISKDDIIGQSNKCDYVESLTGKTKSAGQSIVKNSVFKVKTNNIFKKIKDYTNALSIAAFKKIGERIKFDNLEAAINPIFTIERKVDNTYRVTFLRNCGDSVTDIDLTANILVLDQISSGGPSAKVINTDNNFDETEVISVGHLKILWRHVVILIQLTLSYPEVEYLFKNILMDENGIFMYYYRFVRDMNPFMAWGIELGEEIDVTENQNVIHQLRVYSSFLYVLDLNNYAIKHISKQLFVERQTLEFCDTIANHTILDGDKGYILPYGLNDTQAKLLFCDKECVNHFLTNDSIHPTAEPLSSLECVKRFMKVENIIFRMAHGSVGLATSILEAGQSD